jgi:hypothetical protein
MQWSRQHQCKFVAALPRLSISCYAILFSKVATSLLSICKEACARSQVLLSLCHYHMASVVRQRNQQQCDNEDSAPGLDGMIQQPAAQEESPKAAAVAAAAAKRLHKQTLYKRIQQRIGRIKSWIWWLVEELFEVSCMLGTGPGPMSHCMQLPRQCTCPYQRAR